MFNACLPERKCPRKCPKILIGTIGPVPPKMRHSRLAHQYFLFSFLFFKQKTDPKRGDQLWATRRSISATSNWSNGKHKYIHFQSRTRRRFPTNSFHAFGWRHWPCLSATAAAAAAATAAGAAAAAAEQQCKLNGSSCSRRYSSLHRHYKEKQRPGIFW